jgi:hypothetical protein
MTVLFYNSNVSRIPILENGFSLSCDVLSVSEIKLSVKIHGNLRKEEITGEIISFATETGRTQN